MITYDEMYGRLGNILYTIAQLFDYCDKYNIDYNYICINDTPYFSWFNYKNNLFYNIQKYFVDTETWKNITKNNKRVEHYYTHERNLNLTFLYYNWSDSVKYNPNIWKIFYNKNIFENFIHRLPSKYSDYKDRIVLHIRRDDFLAYDWFKCYVRTIEEINEILSTNDKFFIFSDDMEWCKENIHNKKCVFVDDLIDAECIMLMGYCKDVLPNKNSTFSSNGKLLNEYLTSKGLKI